MASLLKIWVVRWVVPYLDAQGRKKYRRVSRGTPGAQKVKRKSKHWYAQVRDADGKRRRVPLGCSDKAAAQTKLGDLLKGIERGEAGLSEPTAGHRKAPIEAHVAEYESHLRNKPVSAKSLEETLRRLRAIIKDCGFQSLKDIRQEPVERFLVALAERGTGTSTRNSYLKSAKAFLNWCVAVERLEKNPLHKLRPGTGGIRRHRRALTEEELVRLIKATWERPMAAATAFKRGPKRGKRGATIRPESRAKIERLSWEHSLIYKTLVLTGLRRGELESLQVSHLRLDAPAPHLALPGNQTKNKKEAVLLLRPDLVEDLKAWLSATGKAGSDRVFTVSKDLRKLLRRDLEWAGIPWKDAEGKTVDVHALRHTTGTYLGLGCAPGLNAIPRRGPIRVLDQPARRGRQVALLPVLQPEDDLFLLVLRSASGGTPNRRRGADLLLGPGAT